MGATMWTKLFAAVVFLTALGAAVSTTIPAAPLAPPARHVLYPQSSETGAEAKLGQVIPSLRLKNVPLHEAIEHLRELTRANIFVNWRSLEAAGLDRDVPVDVDLHDVTLAEALKWVAKSVSGAYAKVTFTLHGGVIYVANDSDVARVAGWYVYDVRDLLDGEHALKLPAGWAGGGSNPHDPAGARRGEVIDELVNLIQVTIAPDSWEDGGGTGSIHEFRGRLFIRQTWENHQLVEAALSALRVPEKRLWPPASRPSDGID